MTNYTQDVELRIRATNYGKKTTEEVVKALEDLTKAQEQQIKAAEKGEVAAADLEKSYQRIEAAIKALIGQQAIIKQFEAQNKALDETTRKLEEARRAQTQFTNSLKPGAQLTKEQEKQLKSLAGAVATLEKEQLRAQTRTAATAQKLEAFGITAENMASKQRDIVTAVTAANAALERQENAIEGVDAAYAARKSEEQAIAQREQQIRVDNAFAKAERDLAAAIEAEAAAQRKATAAAKEAAQVDAMRDVAHAAEMEALFTREALKREQALKRQADAMRLAADQAERMARVAATTARGKAPVAEVDLAATIRNIQQPAEAALRSIAGLDQAVDTLSARVAAINGPIKNYKQTLQEATAAQAALVAMAGRLDVYRSQIAAVREAREEYVRARDALKELTAQMRAGAAGDDFAQRLRAAQGALAAAASNMGNLTTAARASRDALRQAGVDTRNLAAAEQNLVQQSTRATASMNQLTEAYKKNGAAAESAGKGIFRWFGGEGGRTTLSYAQRLRGELLGLAAGFVGIQASIALASKTLEAYKTNQAIMSRLTVANGLDARKAADDFAYLQATTDRIGIAFTTVAPSFAKFAIAMNAAGFNTQETRFAFEQIAGAAVKAGASIDEVEGILKAFEQMASKGKIQAEELRGQLGDRLPGAFQIAAKAAGMTVEEFSKALELGQVGSDKVVAIAREIGKVYGVAQTGATTLLQAQARFDNATNRFLTSVAEGGFVQAYQALLTRLTRFLEDGSAEKLATAISTAFVGVIDVLEIVIDNLDALKVVLVAIIGLKFVAWLATLPGMLRLVATELTVVNGLLLGLQANLARAGAAAALSSALGATGLTGVMVRLAPAIIGVGNALLFLARSVPILLAAYAAFEAGRAMFGKAEEDFTDTAPASIRHFFEAERDALEKAEKAKQAYLDAKGTKDEQKLKLRYDRLEQIAVSAIAERTNAERAEYEKAQAMREQQQGKVVGPTEDPGDLGAAGQRLKQLREELRKEDEQSEKKDMAARMQAAKRSLPERLKLVDEEFEARRKAAREFYKDQKDLDKALEMINMSSIKRQAAERRDFYAEQQREGESASNRRIKLAQEIGLKLKEIEDDIEKRQADMDVTKPFEERRLARVNAIGHAYDELMKKILQQQKLDPKAADAAKTQLDALTQQRKQLEDINAKRDEADRLMQQFNKAQTIQQNNLAAINSLEESGMITGAEAAQRRNDEIAKTTPLIQAAGEEARKFAESMQSAIDPVRFSEIMSGLTKGMAGANVDAQQIANHILETQRQMNALTAAQAREVEAIQQQRSLGLITSEQEVQMLNAVTVKYGTQLQILSEQLLNFIKIAREAGGLTTEQLDELEAAANRTITAAQYGIQEVSQLNKLMAESILQNGVNAFDSMAQSIAKVVTGQQSISQGFKGMMAAAAEFFAQVLRDIALYIAKQQILNALKSFGGPIGAAAGAMAAGGQHNGGVTGFNRTFTRRVDPAVFATAQRFHNGGLPGLRPDEVPTILQKGEEVVTRDDPRHVLNGGEGAAGGGGVRFVLVDDRTKIPQAMASSEGEKVIMQTLQRNQATLKQLTRG